MNLLTAKVLECAQRFVGVHERKHNTGIEIDGWLVRVGAEPGDPWCAAFAWCMVDDAAAKLGIYNPLPRTASVHRLWDRSPESCKSGEPVPGAVACHDSGGGVGHCGIVVEMDFDHKRIKTLDGNTNAEGSREGDRVAYKWRDLSYWNMGHLDPSAHLDYPPVL